MSVELQTQKLQNLSILAREFETKTIEETLTKLRKKSELWDQRKKIKILENLGIDGVKVEPKAITKCTNWIRAHLFSDIKNLVDNDLKHIVLVGTAGSGKTWLINWLIEQVFSIYPKEISIAIIFTNSMQYNIDNIPKADVVISVVDDAIEHQSSAQYMSKPSQKLAGDWYNIRHVYEKKHKYS